jgi:hypothetical protein
MVFVGAGTQCKKCMRIGRIVELPPEPERVLHANDVKTTLKRLHQMQVSETNLERRFYRSYVEHVNVETSTRSSTSFPVPISGI